MNVDVMKKARQSVLDAPDFNMSDWGHCVACHVCKVSGLDVRLNPDDRLWYGGDEYMPKPAYEAMEVNIDRPNAELADLSYLFHSQGPKDWVIDRMDWLIAKYTPVPEPVPEPAEQEDLVCV